MKKSSAISITAQNKKEKMPITSAAHRVDPAQELLDKVGDISDLDVFHNQILVAVYQRPSEIKTASGMTLHLPDQFRKEDEYQGKVGLVLKAGPLAFVGKDPDEFGGQSVSPGDWVAFRVSDGWSFQLKGSVLCRMLHDVDCKLRLPTPDYVY